jgi:hypothetical protein
MNWFQVLQWESAPLAELARDAESKSRELQAAGEELNAQLNSLTGSGKTVTAVRQAISNRISEIDKQVNYLISVGEIASAGVDGIDDIRADIEDIQQTVMSSPIHIDTSGVVSFIGSLVDSVESIAMHPLNLVKTVADRVAKVLAKATALEVKLVAMMAALGLGIFDNRVNYSASGASKPSLPPAGASEQEVASWWSQQSDANKKWLIENYPEKIGNLNGVDATSRDKANRIVLDQKLNDLPGQIDKLDEEAANAPTPFIRDAILEKKAKLQHELDELNVVNDTLNKGPNPKTGAQGDGVPRQLLGLDSSGRNLKAIVAQGNVDTADHVGVVVPGLNTNVKDTLDDYDNRASAMTRSAKAQVKPGESVAMVEYLGYDAPQNKLEVIGTGYAKEGAVGLAGFLNGVDASREHGAGDAHITLFGHSYGSTTSGMAATLVNEGVVDDIVLAGSPGAGVQNVSEYHVPEGHAWVSAAPYAYDMVQGMGTDFNFGKNPDTMGGFNRLSGDVGRPDSLFDPFGLHMAYFDEGTQAQREIAGVIAGAGKK